MPNDNSDKSENHLPDYPDKPSDPDKPNRPDRPPFPQNITIHINTRPVQWKELTISFKQVVETWNQIAPDQKVLDGLPGIDWEVEGTEEEGIIYSTDDPLPTREGLSFTIDPDYLS